MTKDTEAPTTPADLKQDALDAIAATPSSVAPSDADRKRELADKLEADDQAKVDAVEAERLIAESRAAERERLNPTRVEKKGKDWIDAQYGDRAGWFRETRVADLKRELLGAQQRGDKAYEKNVAAELEAMGHGPKKAAAKENKAARADEEAAVEAAKKGERAHEQRPARAGVEKR